MRDLSDCPDGSASTCRGEGGPTCASTAPLAGSIDRGKRWHETRMKNAPSLGPRQRRQLQGVLGGSYVVELQL